MLEAFFKETIVGIIILGAIGSILAAAVLWTLSKVTKLAVPKIYALIKQAAIKVAIFSISPGIKNQVMLCLDADQNKLDAYYSSQKTKIIIALILASWLLIWLLFRLKVDGLEAFSLEAISCISLMFLLFGVAIRSHLSLMVPLLVDIDVQVEGAIKAMDQETIAAYEKLKANKALQRTGR